MAAAVTDLEPVGVPPKRAWRMLGCSNAKGYELLATGEIESYAVGRARRVVVESIRRYIARNISKPSRDAA